MIVLVFSLRLNDKRLYLLTIEGDDCNLYYHRLGVQRKRLTKNVIRFLLRGGRNLLYKYPMPLMLLREIINFHSLGFSTNNISKILRDRLKTRKVFIVSTAFVYEVEV